jgi:hypothetical protein
MKNILFNLIVIGLLAFSTALVGCKKKCQVDDLSKDSGEIIENVTIIPSGGSLTGNMGSDFVIDADHLHSGAFQIRFGDAPSEAVDYSKYYILANPIKVKCNVALERSVTIDDANQKVIYSVKATQCPDCEGSSNLENYVLVPAFPSNYTLELDTAVITKQ